MHWKSTALQTLSALLKAQFRGVCCFGKLFWKEFEILIYLEMLVKLFQRDL